MSSERRHQLEHNELAVWLGKVNKSIEPHSKPIAAVVAVAVVAGIAWTFLTTEQLAKRSDATLQLIQAAAGGDSEVLAKVGDTYSDTEAGSWARLYQGQQLMIQGMTALYRNREEAEILLSDAKQALQSAVNSSSNNLLASRGHYAIAQIEEALGDVSNEQGEDGESMLAAIDSYQKVIDLNESEAMVERAEERIAALKKPATREFIAWFSEQDFSPTNDP
ncbi:MAG: tetratricopeptide repeat protein, partial [Planctomycetota bacterium]|nr:tetratricopeptide repeat protein [Planctomycetota bacterium]